MIGLTLRTIKVCITRQVYGKHEILMGNRVYITICPSTCLILLVCIFTQDYISDISVDLGFTLMGKAGHKNYSHLSYGYG